jgi:hypothetical protein
MHIGFDRPGHEESLAKADKALIGVDADPEDICKFLKPYRFDGGDLHWMPEASLLLALSRTLTVFSKCSPILNSAVPTSPAAVAATLSFVIS